MNLKKGFFNRLTGGLVKTKKNMVSKVRLSVGMHSRLDADLFDEMEEILIQADVGMDATMKIVDWMRKDPRADKEDNAEIILDLLYDAIFEIIQRHERTLEIGPERPYVILVIGVNGTGKTTTIGKIAQTLKDNGLSTMLVAADTFRAAAVEQLEIWAKRTKSEFIAQQLGADPASVCFDALQAAKAKKVDVVLIDTAGRLHTKVNLMEELKKVDRVIKKQIPEAPHETLLILDATTGQNAVSQAKTFSEATGVSGLVMTKLDGTAKGGILIAIRDQFDIPILKIGVGEDVEDLQDFNPQEYVDALFAED